MTIGSRLSQSRICVKGCQTNRWSSCASLCIWLMAIDYRLECSRELADILHRVSGGQRNPQPRRAAGDCRVADGWDKDALRSQFGCRSHSFRLIAEDERDDGAWKS